MTDNSIVPYGPSVPTTPSAEAVVRDYIERLWDQDDEAVFLAVGTALQAAIADEWNSKYHLQLLLALKASLTVAFARHAPEEFGRMLATLYPEESLSLVRAAS